MDSENGLEELWISVVVWFLEYLITRLMAVHISQAVALGDGWIAIATSLNMLRLFSVGGIQQNILCLPGPVVAMAAHKQKLCITYSSILCEYVSVVLL